MCRANSISPVSPGSSRKRCTCGKTLRSSRAASKLSLASTGDAKSHRWTGQFQASNLRGDDRRPTDQLEPADQHRLRRARYPTGPVVEKLECQSSFIHLTASGTPDHFTAGADCDLNRLATELGQFVDFGSVRPAGIGQVTLDWHARRTARFKLRPRPRSITSGLRCRARVWSEPSLTVNANAAGLISPSGPTRIDRASLEVTTGTTQTAVDRSAVGCVA